MKIKFIKTKVKNKEGHVHQTARYKVGDTVELPDAKANSYIKHGLAAEVKGK